MSFQYDRAGITEQKGDWDPKKRAKEIIAKLDVSGDKKLSKEEFVTGYDNSIHKNSISIDFFSVLDA